ncbi:hypothetical protein GCM10020001_055090 [Nonomuraea salmonea]|jgi:ABC-type thiamine transport system ATPase subunit
MVAHVPLLEIDGLTWLTHGVRQRLSPGPLTLDAEQAAVVVAGDPAAGEAFADVLLGLEAPHEGRLRLDGRDVTALSTADRAIGLVPAGGGLLPHLTVKRNLELAARKDLALVSHGQVAYMSGWMDIQGFMRAKPHELAHDERLTVALARVMCRPMPPKMVVVEDRTGCEPCHAAVSRALHSKLAVLIVTDDGTRVTSLASSARVWEITDADQP